MTAQKNETFGEETIIGLYKRTDSPGGAIRLEIKAGQPVIPIGAAVDCLFGIRIGTVRLVAPGGQKTELLLREFEGHPHKNMPLIGARYFFTRRKASIAYVAKTDVVAYAIDSALLVDIHNDREMLTLMRELIVNSDVAEQFAPIAARALDIPVGRKVDADVLAMIREEIRKPVFRPRLDPVLMNFFRKFMEQRRKSAAEADIEASVVTDPPAIHR